jgi:hypothetical protein
MDVNGENARGLTVEPREAAGPQLDVFPQLGGEVANAGGRGVIGRAPGGGRLRGLRESSLNSFWKSSVRATKSVSQFNSINTAVFPVGSM